MFKKVFLFAVLSAVLCAFSSLTFADFKVAGFPLISDFNRPYFGAGLSGYYFHDDNFDVGTAGSTAAALGKINDRGWTPRYHVVLGYQFLNCTRSWLTQLMGNEQAVELSFDTLNKNNTTRKSSLGTGSLWFISGGTQGALITDAYIYNVQLRAKHRLTDMGLYFKGHRYTTNRRLTLTPYTGVVWSNLQERYSFDALYNATAIQDKDMEAYDVKANYYGVALGNRLNFDVWKNRVITFVDLEAQLLHAVAKLHATQNPLSQSQGTNQLREINTSENQNVTYRAILSAGVTYKFTNKPDSISMDLKGGVDRWGYSPTVVTPTNTSAPAVHIHGSTQTNGFVMLNVHVPIP